MATDLAFDAVSTGNRVASDRPLPVEIKAGSAAMGGTTDGGPSWTSVWGITNAPVQSSNMTSIADVTAVPTSGQKLVIDDLIISADTAMKFTFTEETSGTVMFAVYVPAGGVTQVTPRGKRKLATADKKLRCTASVAGNVSILAGYHSEA